jgi:hypothetical protein
MASADTLHEFLLHDTQIPLRLSIIASGKISDNSRQALAYLQARGEYGHRPVFWHVPGMPEFSTEPYDVIDYVYSEHKCDRKVLSEYSASLSSLKWDFANSIGIVLLLNVCRTTEDPKKLSTNLHFPRQCKVIYYTDRKSKGLAETLLQQIHKKQSTFPHYINVFRNSDIRVEGQSYCDSSLSAELKQKGKQCKAHITAYNPQKEPLTDKAFHTTITLEYPHYISTVWSCDTATTRCLIVFWNNKPNKLDVWQYYENYKLYHKWNIYVVRVLYNSHSDWGVLFVTKPYFHFSFKCISNNWSCAPPDYSHLILESLDKQPCELVKSCEIEVTCKSQKKKLVSIPLQFESSNSPRAKAMLHRFTITDIKHHIAQEIDHLENMFVDWKDILSSWTSPPAPNMTSQDITLLPQSVHRCENEEWVCKRIKWEKEDFETQVYQLTEEKLELKSHIARLEAELRALREFHKAELPEIRARSREKSETHADRVDDNSETSYLANFVNLSVNNFGCFGFDMTMSLVPQLMQKSNNPSHSRKRIAETGYSKHK